MNEHISQVMAELLLIFLTKMRKFVEKRVTLFYYGISVLYHSAERTTCDCEGTAWLQHLVMRGLNEWRKKYVPDREKRDFG